MPLPGVQPASRLSRSCSQVPGDGFPDGVGLTVMDSPSMEEHAVVLQSLAGAADALVLCFNSEDRGSAERVGKVWLPTLRSWGIRVRQAQAEPTARPPCIRFAELSCSAPRAGSDRPYRLPEGRRRAFGALPARAYRGRNHAGVP